jgi:hypothetical protein
VQANTIDAIEMTCAGLAMPHQLTTAIGLHAAAGVIGSSLAVAEKMSRYCR